MQDLGDSSPLVDIHGVRDIYADGIGSVEDLGDCWRFTLFTWNGPPGRREREVVCRIIRQKSAVARDRMLLDQMMAMAGSPTESAQPYN